MKKLWVLSDGCVRDLQPAVARSKGNGDMSLRAILILDLGPTQDRVEGGQTLLAIDDKGR